MARFRAVCQPFSQSISKQFPVGENYWKTTCLFMAIKGLGGLEEAHGVDVLVEFDWKFRNVFWVTQHCSTASRDAFLLGVVVV